MQLSEIQKREDWPTTSEMDWNRNAVNFQIYQIAHSSEQGYLQKAFHLLSNS